MVNFVSRYKNKILNVNIAIIILSLIIANNIYKRQTAILESLKKKRDTEIKKNESLENISQLEKKINAYRNYFNEKDISLVITKINEIAKASDIKIISFKPQTARDYPVYVKQSFLLTISAKDYRQLGEFVSKIENSPDIYMIDSFNIKSLALEQEKKALTDKIGVELIVSTIVFKG